MAGSGKTHVEKMNVDPIFGNHPEYLLPKNGGHASGQTFYTELCR